MVVGERDAGDCLAVELPIGIDGVAASHEAVVGNPDIGDRSKIVVDHDRRRLAPRIDNRVVGDNDIGDAAVDLDAIVVRRAGGFQVMDVVILNDGIVAIQRDAVLDMMDVVWEKCSSSPDAIRTLIARPYSINLTVTYHHAFQPWLDADNIKSGGAHTGLHQCYIRRVNVDCTLNIEIRNDRTRSGDNKITRGS
jgi:hypothetical protein